MAEPVTALAACTNMTGYASGWSSWGLASSQLGGWYTVSSSTSRSTAGAMSGVAALNWNPLNPAGPSGHEV